MAVEFGGTMSRRRSWWCCAQQVDGTFLQVPQSTTTAGTGPSAVALVEASTRNGKLGSAVTAN